MRLGVISRTGIVLTFVWTIFGVSYTTWTNMTNRNLNWNVTYDSCVSGFHRQEAEGTYRMGEQDYRNCQAQADRGTLGDTWITSTLAGLAIGMGGAAIVWIIGGAAYWSFRWVLAGRRRSPQV